MKRVGNELKEITWNDAISIVSEKLKKAGKSSGFISTAGILNEDALALKKFASDVVKTKNIDTTVSLYADADSMRGDSADLEGADLMVLVGLNPDQWVRVLPALDAIIRKKVDRGAKLIVINSGEPKIASVATVNLKGDEALTLSAFAKTLEEQKSKEQRTAGQQARRRRLLTLERLLTFLQRRQTLLFSQRLLFMALLQTLQLIAQ